MGHILTRVRVMIEELQKWINRRKKILGYNSDACNELDNVYEELQDILDYIHEDAMDRRKYGKEKED